MPYNLASPNGLLEKVDLARTAAWLARETTQVKSRSIRRVILHVAGHLDDFVRWPARAVLLWRGCDRITPNGQRAKYHTYPESIRKFAKAMSIHLDRRANGPAIAAFQLAGGIRPERFGSSNAWSIHHIYSGKFHYFGRKSSIHACKDGEHFTQSAGVIATHPVADSLCDEFPFFAWLVRAESFRKFGYDPDAVFSPDQVPMGFAKGYSCEVIFGERIRQKM